MGPVQRYPRGILEILGLKGLSPPSVFADFFQGTLETMQLFGNSQLQLQSAANAALAEAGNITLTVPADQYWMLFQASALIAKTSTMTALRGAIQFNQVAVVSQDLGPFGATETGAVRVCYACPYPRIMLPGQTINFNLEILGTDATANCLLSASVGVLA